MNDNYEEEYQYPKSFSFSVWKKLWPYIRPLKSRIIMVIVFLSLNTAAEAAYPLVLKQIVDENLRSMSFSGLPLLIAIFGGLVLIKLVSGFCFLRVGMRTDCRIAANLRGAVFRHLQILPISYYNKTPVGYMMARATSDTGLIGEVIIWTLVDVCWSVVYIVFALCAMFFVLDWRLALVTTAFILALGFITNWFQRKILERNRDVRRQNSVMTGAMNEGIVGARTTKTLVYEDQSLSEFKAITAKMKKMAVHLAGMRSVYGPLIYGVATVSAVTVLVIGGWLSIEHGLFVGTLAAFIQYASEIVNPLNQVAYSLPEFVAAQANVERVTAMLERQPEIVERPEAIEKYGDNLNPKFENWEQLEGKVEFNDVTFMYPDGNVNVLENFQLTVEKGQTIAIVGETGAGKSTLVNLVCRFFEPTAGEVLIDGRDIRERTQAWLHSHLGYVLQTPHLFSGSILENIRYGKLDASDDDVKAAAKIVSADIFIEKLEKQWDTDVGEGGDRLSTGQKQLVSLARAVLADPRIFVLDEATSSIDTETELLIQHAISVLLKGRTSFVIAHRLSTIRGADLILLVEDGKIVERGTHDELMAKRGGYFELYTEQFIKE